MLYASAKGTAGAVVALVGGDFNCVLDPELDRVTNGRSPSKPTESASLTRVVADLQLVDPVLDGLPDCLTARDRARHAAATHTFGTTDSSARLDRFYVSAAARGHVLGVMHRQPPLATDHRMVVLRWRPDDARWTFRRPPRLYPHKALDDTKATDNPTVVARRARLTAIV